MAKSRGQVLHLSLDLRSVEPTVRARFAVPADMSLADLLRVLQLTFQRADDHLHSLQIGTKRYGPPHRRGHGLDPPVQPEVGLEIGTLARKGPTAAEGRLRRRR
mgnify:FL=1